MSFLREAFRQLNTLNEEKFSLDDTSAEELLDINDNSDDVEEVVSIADLDAETPEDIESKDYSGKIIVQCPVCLNDMYKDISELEAEENEDGVYETVEEEECPFCSTTGKLLVVAKTVPFEGDDEVEIKVTPKEDADIEDSEEEKEEVIDESNKYCDDKEDCDEEDDDSDDSLDEDLNNIELDTSSDHISISSTPKDSEEGNMLGELSDEDFAQMAPEEEATDNEVEDFDEESFDSANESLLRREYSNVKSYKTSNVFELNNNLIVEGVVTFRNGNSYKTTYRFKPSSVTSRNSLKLIGENFELAPGKKAFRINAKLNKGVIVTESMNYLFKDRTSNKICEGLVRCGRKLNEDRSTWKDTDAEDSKIIRGAIRKRLNRNNAKLTDTEKSALERNGYDYEGSGVEVLGRGIRYDRDTRPWERSAKLLRKDNVNLADMGRKSIERGARNYSFGLPGNTYDSRSFIRPADAKYRHDQYWKYDEFKDAIKKSNRNQAIIDNADAEAERERIAAQRELELAKQKYDSSEERITNNRNDKVNRAQRNIDDANATKNKLLKRESLRRR